MEDLHTIFKDLQLALQTLLKKYNSLKKENEHLKKLNEEIIKELSEKNKLINTAEEKMATNNINELYGSEEKELLQSKIDIYLKDIEKCLALLNA
jgi:hypothetical protein